MRLRHRNIRINQLQKKEKKLSELVCNKTNIFILRNTAQMCRLLVVGNGGPGTLAPSLNPALSVNFFPKSK